MITVWKYPIPFGESVISAPHPHKFLHFAIQGDTPTVWLQVNTEQHDTKRAYLITGTGHPLPDRWPIYLGTTHHEIFVWHLWEVPV